MLITMRTEAQIVQKIADSACRSIAISVRREMQRMDPCLCSDFDNAWNELCVQVQGTSLYSETETYLQTLESMIYHRLQKLDDNSKSAIWYQTDNFERVSEEQLGRTSYDDNELIEFILHGYVLSMAASWENKQTRDLY